MQLGLGLNAFFFTFIQHLAPSLMVTELSQFDVHIPSKATTSGVFCDRKDISSFPAQLFRTKQQYLLNHHDHHDQGRVTKLLPVHTGSTIFCILWLR